MNIATKTYALAKIFRNYKRRNIILDSMPIRLWIETSLACNLKCVMCPNKDMQDQLKGVMDFELFKKIIDEASGFVNDVYLHHRGEPFINPRLFDMIKYAKAKGLNVRFHSNAALLDHSKAEELIAAAPDLISISFDGFEKKLYEDIRRGAHFETTIENICGLLELKRKHNVTKPYVIVEKIDFPDRQKDIDPKAVESLVARFKGLGLDELIVKEEYTWATENAPELTCERSYTVCTFPWYAMVICWDGTVTPCPQDYNAYIKLGNVGKKTLREIWNDEPYTNLRSNQINNIEVLKLCRKCDRLTRKQVGGVPYQYLFSFLSDHLIGYGKIRKLIGSFERN